ncbi:MAG TPA: GNAT family N-acetyltransferase [Puia sp.]|nr:GNAT family N-acetyltransferase [Puia sp.]
MVDIRVATSADAAMIADLSRRAFQDAFGQFNSPDNMEKFLNGEFERENLTNQVGSQGNTFFIATADNRIIGYARLCESVNPPGIGEFNAVEISRIYVEQEAIARGIGSRLMQACISEARKRRKEVIWLGVWEHNPRAIAFYRKFGFERFGKHVFMLGDDPQTDWLMKRELNS